MAGRISTVIRMADSQLGAIVERLEALEDRVSRLSFQQHRHGDESDSYAAAYARGFQDGFANIRREIESLFLRLVNEPVPSAARRSSE